MIPSPLELYLCADCGHRAVRAIVRECYGPCTSSVGFTGDQHAGTEWVHYHCRWCGQGKFVYNRDIQIEHATGRWKRVATTGLLPSPEGVVTEYGLTGAQ
jgi:hypothetical protein